MKLHIYANTTFFQFVLHSPSASALKWWPGGLGKTADHAVVMAQLVTPDGARRGPHAFMVQLRDVKTHRTLKGVKVLIAERNIYKACFLLTTSFRLVKKIIFCHTMSPSNQTNFSVG